MGKEVFDPLQHTLVAENGAASKAEEVLAFSRVELAADVVHKVLEDLHIERELVDRAGESFRFSILVGCDAQAILVDITEHLFRQFFRLLLEFHLSHLPVVLPPVVQRSSLHSKAFWNNNLSEPTQLLIEPSESSYHKMAGNNNCIAVGGNYFCRRKLFQSGCIARPRREQIQIYNFKACNAQNIKIYYGKMSSIANRRHYCPKKKFCCSISC